jgi:low-affinity ferrous iron transport protein
MTFLSKAKVILVPPNKGDIKVRCKITTLPSSEYLNIDTKDNDEKYTNETIIPTSTEKSASKNILTYISHNLSLLFNRKKDKFQNEINAIEKLEEYETDNDYASPLDTFIGLAVDITGSGYMMVLVILILIAWIIWGALAGAPDNWQIVMQDGQSIQTYVWDTFLMRQQLDDNEKFLILFAKLKSRLGTHKRLILKLQTKYPEINFISRMEEIKNLENHEFRHVKFNKKKTFDKISEIASSILGNLYTVIIYWIGVFIWIGCGSIPLNNGTKDEPLLQKFSNNWQMYINTAVAIELLFTSVFLEHVRFKSNEFISKQIDVFNHLDRDLECIERQFCNDLQDNELIVIKRCPRDKIQKGISFYSNVIGNGLGLIISTCVFITWFGIGNVMHWSSNWWLVIGTYTGLVGFIDGFVLREVFFSLTNYEHDFFYEIFDDSQKLLDICDIPIEMKKYEAKITFDVKISLWINKVCSNKWSVIWSCGVVLGLIIMACALLWSETAQLICNTPTMIIEGFFLLILIQAHNWADAERSWLINELIKSRMLVYNYVDVCYGEKLPHRHHANIDLDEEMSQREQLSEAISV